MNVMGILKVCAIVGLSAVTMVSTMLKVKEEQNGLINQNVPAFNNGNPYNSNMGEMNMYNNNAYGSQSRRFYGCAQPSYPMANGPMMMGPYQQPMRPLTFGSPIPQPSAQLQMALAQHGYPVPCYNSAAAYQGGFNAVQQYGYQPSGYSRRNAMPNGMMYQQPQPQQMSYPNPFVNQCMGNGVYREPTYSQYGYGYGNDSGVAALYSGGSNYGYGYSNDYGYGGNYQQPQQQQQPQVQTLGNYNANLIGSAARYRCWSPETSGSSCTYYGYDDNMPSYPTSAPPQQPPRMMQPQPMMNNGYGFQQPPMMTPPPPQQNQYTDEQMKLYAEIERFKQSEAARANAMRQQPPRSMSDPMDGRLHNTIRPFSAENAWFSASEMKAPQQPQPQPSNVTVAPIPPFMQNGPAEMQQPNPPQSVGGSSITWDAMLSNGSHQQEPAPANPTNPQDIVMQFGDNWVPVEQQAEAYNAPPQQQQPQQAVGVQPLYTMPEQQPQQPPIQMSPPKETFSMV